MTEQRKFTRIRYNAIIDYLARREFFMCEMWDLSAGGIFASTPDPIPVGEIVHLDFYLPGVDHKFKLKGRVARVVGEDEARSSSIAQGMGIEFVDAPPDTLREIDAFVQSILKDNGSRR